MVLQGCSERTAPVQTEQNQTTDVIAPAASDSTATNTSVSDAIVIPNSWSVAKEMEVLHPTSYIGLINESNGITVGVKGEIHYTSDGGKTWPKGENYTFCRFGLDIPNEKFAISCGNGAAVMASSDGGKMWEPVAIYGEMEPKQNRFLSFVDNNSGWIGSPYQFASTQDGAKTWNEMKLPDGAADISAIFLRTANDGYLLDTKGILYITADGGKTWSQQDLGYQKLNMIDADKNPGKILKGSAPNAAINFTDADNGKIVINGLIDGVGFKTWVFQTTDGGKTWSLDEIKLGDDFTMVSVYISRDGKYVTIHCQITKKVILLKTE